MKITETELLELGISRNLWNSWKETLNCLWSMAKKQFPAAKNCENSIQINEWQVQANFVNNKFIEVTAEKDHKQMMCIRLSNNLPTIVHCIYLLIKVDKAIHK